jgi:hypothetical protein
VTHETLVKVLAVACYYLTGQAVMAWRHARKGKTWKAFLQAARDDPAVSTTSPAVLALLTALVYAALLTAWPLVPFLKRAGRDRQPPAPRP